MALSLVVRGFELAQVLVGDRGLDVGHVLGNELGFVLLHPLAEEFGAPVGLLVVAEVAAVLPPRPQPLFRDVVLG